MAAPRSAGNPLLPWLGIAAIVVLLDQVTKALIMRTLAIGDSITLNPVLNIVHWRNTGAAFSFLHGSGGWQRWFFVGLATVAAVFIVWLLRRHGTQRLFAAALALILGGAIGNVIDRLRFGAVVDFIHAHAFGWSWYVFNVADAAIVCGVAALLLDGLRPRRRDGTLANGQAGS